MPPTVVVAGGRAITAEERAQLAALPADTTAALAGKAAGVVVANNSDPSVTGLAAAIGVIAVTIDGSKAWQKWGTGNTQWAAIHDTVTTLGAAGTIITVSNLACDTLGGFEVTFDVDAALTNYAGLWLQLNGSETLFRHQRSWPVQNAGASTWVNSAHSKVQDVNYSSGITGRVAQITIEARNPGSGNPIRIFRLHSWGFFNSGGADVYYLNDGFMSWAEAGELTTIGLRSSVTGSLAATTNATLRRI